MDFDKRICSDIGLVSVVFETINGAVFVELEKRLKEEQHICNADNRQYLELTTRLH